MSARLIRLRYAGRCVQCASAIPAADQGWWSAEDKTVRCRACGPAQQSVYGVAGGSARAEHDRREQRRKESIRAEHSRIVRSVRSAKGAPQSETAWGKGAAGEQRVGMYLDRLRSRGIVVLHDRRIPGTRANIDHIVVARSGVWVVDTKNHDGRVERVDHGRRFSPDHRLRVKGRDRMKLVRAMPKQVEQVRGALADAAVPIHPVLCFTGAEWPMFTTQFMIDGVLVTPPKPLLKAIERADERGVAVVEVSERLVAGLPAAT